MLCKRDDPSHGHAKNNNNRLGEGGEIGGFDCGTNFKKRRANLKRSQTQIGQVAEEDVAGGCAVAGSHLIKMWCRTHAVVALSSAEAELYGLVSVPAETMGLISMYKDLGTHTSGLVLGDASAALAIVARRVLGKLWRLETNYSVYRLSWTLSGLGGPKKFIY